MPVFKNYSEDGTLLEVINEPLSSDNIDRFIKENGEHTAQIYLEALQEFTSEIDNMRHRYTDGIASGLNTPQKMKTQIIQLFHRNKNMLESPQAKSLLSPNSRPDL